MPVKINGSSSGSVTLAAPASGSDVTLTLPTTGFGKILQVVRATDSTNRSTTSTTFVDVTGMSVTITPQKSDSAILIVVTFGSQINVTSGSSIVGYYQITDSSNNAISGAQETHIGSFSMSGSGAVYGSNTAATLIGYATPATTSATTYKVRFRADSGATAWCRNASGSSGQIYALEISA